MIKISTNHPFTKAQLKSLNKELDLITSVEIQGMRGAEIPSFDNNYRNIKIKHSVYDLNVYLCYMDFSNPDFAKSKMYQIDTKGNVDKEVRTNLEFVLPGDRVNYFANLEIVEFYY
jgi:hypothetical protein